MTKSKVFAIRMLISMIIVLSLYSALHGLKIISLSLPLFKIVLLLIPVVFLIGGVIIISGFNKEPDVFVGRFLLLTTFQLLAVLSIIVAVAYKLNGHLRAFGFQFISIFILLMLIQSFFIVKINNK